MRSRRAGASDAEEIKKDVDQGKQEDTGDKKDDAGVITEWKGFTDPNHEGNKFLSKKEAIFRSQIVSDVNYTIALGLLKGGKTFNGKVKIDFKLSAIQA